MELINIVLTVASGCFWVVSSAVIENNGYRGVAIGFSETVDQSAVSFDKLKAVLSKASEVLFHATRRRSFFEEFVFVLPRSWEDSSMCERTAEEKPQKIDLLVADSPDDPRIRAVNSRGCGQEGDFVHVPLDWLRGDDEDLAVQFVQQWSTFRYGVFSENPEPSGSCIASKDNWSPGGCFNPKIDKIPDFDARGLPRCPLPEDFSSREDLRSSIMFQANSTRMADFCDGTLEFPHNPIAPSLHNRLCRGQPTWSVVKSGDDFIYGRNREIQGKKPPKRPTFSCFPLSRKLVTLVLQNSSATILSMELTEIRYALSHFLTTMGPADSAVNLITFADVAYEESKALESLSRQELDTLLDTRLKQTGQVGDVCAICGLKRAYQADSKEHSPQAIVLFLWESSLKSTKQAELVELIRSSPKVELFLMLVEDTEGDVVSRTLRQTVESTGGQVFLLRSEIIFMVSELNIALIEAFGTNLRRENKALLVHKKLYENVTSFINDEFSTTNAAEGRLLYTMHCTSPGLIRNTNSTCSVWDTESQTYKCGKEIALVETKDFIKEWKFSFERVDYIRPVKCISLAWVKVDGKSSAFSTLRGWLNRREINPEKESLIIYAEATKRKDWEVAVEAMVLCPGMKDSRLELRDNGNGDPDTIKGDSIFSKYFTAFEDKGHCEVMIVAHYKKAGKVKFFDKLRNTEKTITQIKMLGSFQVIETPPREDIYPPNRVADLRVAAVDHEERTILLHWTAPGNDYDSGTAHQYIFRLSRSWMTLNDITFDVEENILLMPLEKSSPAKGGDYEKARFQCPYHETENYYIALKAADENRNTGKVSNIINVHLRQPSVNTTTTTTVSDKSSSIISSESTFTDDIKETVTSESSTQENNATTPCGAENKDGLFIERTLAIIVFTSAGVILLLLILSLIIVCCCWCKATQKTNNRKLTKMRDKAPYNLNVAYKNGSETSLNEENLNVLSMSSMPEPRNAYSNVPNGGQTEHRLSYHTEQSLKEIQKEGDRNELGFKVVEPMPAYATSSLSRFGNRKPNLESLNISPQNSNPEESMTRENSYVYSLGVV